MRLLHGTSWQCTYAQSTQARKAGCKEDLCIGAAPLTIRRRMFKARSQAFPVGSAASVVLLARRPFTVVATQKHMSPCHRWTSDCLPPSGNNLSLVMQQGHAGCIVELCDRYHPAVQSQATGCGCAAANCRMVADVGTFTCAVSAWASVHMKCLLFWVRGRCPDGEDKIPIGICCFWILGERASWPDAGGHVVRVV